jgi:hypothetical protein
MRRRTRPLRVDGQALFENPSIQDLISTPIVALVLTDPLGALNGVFERLLSIRSDVRVDMKPSPRSSREHGVSFKLTLAW